MGLVSSIFGQKDEIEYIREIDSDLHYEVSFFLKLEELCKSKIELAKGFERDWQANFSKLKEHVSQSKRITRTGLKTIRKFKKRIEKQDSDLL